MLCVQLKIKNEDANRRDSTTKRIIGIMTAEQQTPEYSESEKTGVEAGTLLKNRREELGLTQKQVADRLRLRVSIIENIDNNDFSSDQVATFTRGYLRSYARAVGLEESVVLCALDGCEETTPEEQEMRSFSRQTNREKHDSRIMTLTWGIFAIIIGISSVWWWQNQETAMVDLTSQTEQELEIEQAAQQEPSLDFTTLAEEESSEIASAEPATEEVLPQETVTEVTLESPAVEEAVSTDETPVVESEPKTEEAPVTEAAVEEESSTTAAAPAAEATPNLLSMSFTDDCWIQVKDSTGKTLSTGVKKAGQSLELSGNLPYSVILGAPENVSMTLASEPVDLSGYTSGKVARFNLP